MITFKKFIIVMATIFLPLNASQISASVVVPMQVNYTDPELGQNAPQRGPITVPSVSIEDYTLTFTTPCYGYTLVLIDENDEVAYTTIISSSTVNLPSTLSDDYELRLIPNDGSGIYFYGYVEF